MSDQDSSLPNTNSSPFLQLLSDLAARGYTQIEIARRIGMPPQYLSDVKSGRRGVSELLARRLGQAFQVNYLDLLEEPNESSAALQVDMAQVRRLPLLRAPVAGEPEQAPEWTGSFVDVVGIEARRADAAVLPYVLEFGTIDRHKKILEGDLVLISQKTSGNAEIKVVAKGEDRFLARQKSGGWEPLSIKRKDLVRDCEIIGECLGIIWRQL